MIYIIVVGITGPMGAGKSSVCDYLYNIGFKLVDADKVSKYVIDENLSCRLQLARHFGKDILDSQGNLIRHKLAERAFLDRENVDILNKITHPLIVREINLILNTYKLKNEKFVILDVPLLFESNLDKCCDFTIAILADKNIRFKRVLNRDKLNENLISMKFLAQNSNDYYKKRADYTIINNDNLQSLFDAVKMIFKEKFGVDNEM